MMRPVLTALALLSAAPVLAECPAHVMDEAERQSLLDRLREAPDFRTARDLSDGLWRMWTAAPDAMAQEMLDNGVERLRLSDFDTAIRVFDELVAYCPDYAEGYNQRAFAHFLRQDFAPALADLDRTLELNPQHIGALAGKALTLIGLGREAEALPVLESAVALNPWLNERSMIPGLRQKLGARDL